MIFCIVSLDIIFIYSILCVRVWGCCSRVSDGYILRRINGEDVENIPFELVMAKIGRAKSPHIAEFLRYDYRFDRFHLKWRSLQELRDMGVCLEDPTLQRANFVSMASRGDTTMIKTLLLQGQDPNSRDYSGATALLMAAANKHQDTIEVLAKAGAEINCRDKNVSCVLIKYDEVQI